MGQWPQGGLAQMQGCPLRFPACRVCLLAAWRTSSMCHAYPHDGHFFPTVPLPPGVQVLTDRQMRREVVPGLPLHRVCQLLERFEPDDCAPDPLPPGARTRGVCESASGTCSGCAVLLLLPLSLPADWRSDW